MSLLSQSPVVYKSFCPGCSSSYIGETAHFMGDGRRTCLQK